jgi:glycosyltransferase involved in cell wall biosynthesis
LGSKDQNAHLLPDELGSAKQAALAEGFDPAFYLRRYPDLAAAGVDPLEHYVNHGRAEGRLPRLTRFDGCVDILDSDHIIGWALDRANPAEPAHVAVLCDREVIAVIRADQHRRDVLEVTGESISCGFRCHIAKLNGYRSSSVVSVLVIDPELAAVLEALCQERDRSLSYEAISFDKCLGTQPVALHGHELPISLETAKTSELANTDSAVCLLEIQDLLNFLSVHNRVTGIQRTVCGIIKSLLRRPRLEYGQFAFSAVSDRSGYVNVLDNTKLLSLVENALEGRCPQEKLRHAVHAMIANSALYAVKRKDIFVITGAYWIVKNYGQKLLDIKKKGAVIGTYIYDIIPITHPQWVTASTNRAVLDSAFDVLAVSDFFLTISEFVLKDVSKLLNLELGESKPILPVPLPHEVGFLQSDSAGANVEPAKRPISLRYVLCVCTLEGRKNHFLLYRVWAALVRKYGFEQVPRLVLVGRWGWRIEEFREACEATNYLNGKISVRREVDDIALSQLYLGCIFTVFPSFVEGWGLPVGESLSLGKFCVASQASSIPEVGGDFVDYIDPHDFFQAFEVLERAIFDEPYLDGRTRNIRERFQPRTWADFIESFMSAVKRLSREPQQAQMLPSLVDGQLLSFPDISESNLVSWKAKRGRFALASHWHPLEEWGAWSSDACAEIAFSTQAPKGTAVVVWLELRLPNPYGGEEIVVDSSTGTLADLTEVGLTETPTWVKILTSVGDGGVISLRLRRPHAFAKEEETRKLFVGISGLAFHKAGHSFAGFRPAHGSSRPIDLTFQVVQH